MYNYEVMLRLQSLLLTGVTRAAYPSGAHEFTPGEQWCSCCSILSFLCSVCRSLLSFFFWSLYFFLAASHLRLLITSSVFSSYLKTILTFTGCSNVPTHTSTFKSTTDTFTTPAIFTWIWQTWIFRCNKTYFNHIILIIIS